MSPVRRATARAAAKINLHLGVGGRRDDGFHELHTVYQAITLHSTLVATTSDTWSLTTTAAAYVDGSVLPPTEDNIVTQAARALAHHHRLEPCAAVEVAKGIPVAGGLAGGSADAAAALVALDELWETRTPREDLLEIAAELGSDVPFALLGHTALGLGHGELVEPVLDPGEWWWVVVPDREGMSTPAVYAHFDELNPGADPAPPTSEALVAALATGDPHRLAPTLFNGLQESAFDLRPALRELVGHGEDLGALRGLVSGSGPTVLFLCASEAHAGDVADRLDAETVLVASGPTAGALS